MSPPGRGTPARRGEPAGARDRAARLLEGPLGVAVVAELVGVDAGAVVGVDLGGVRYRSNGFPPVSAGPGAPGVGAKRGDPGRAGAVGEVVGQRVAARGQEWLPDASSRGGAVELLHAVGEVVEGIAFSAASRWLEVREVLDQVGDALLPAAVELVAHPATSWWWSAAPLDAQRWCGPPPVLDPGDAWWTGTDEDSVDHAGCWWVSPPGIATTRATPDGACVRTHCREGHTYVEPGTEVIASVSGIERARVYEVATAADWVDLVEAYPRPTPANAHEQWSRWSGHRGPWWLPDWGGCASEWDAVHISAGAYLSAAYRALPTRGGATFLAGWDPDQSAWLTTALTIGAPTASPSP